jgi:hypothetical protein
VGNFYTNFSILTEDQGRVVQALSDAEMVGYVFPPQAGFVVVCEDETDMQDEDAIGHVGAHLSAALGTPALCVLNHDDDILCYWLFEDGAVTESYNSAPEYFGDDAESDPMLLAVTAARLCAVLGKADAQSAVEAILSNDGYTFAIDRHTALVGALGLPEGSIGAGFNYIENGEIPETVNNPDQVIRVG